MMLLRNLEFPTTDKKDSKVAWRQYQKQ